MYDAMNVEDFLICVFEDTAGKRPGYILSRMLWGVISKIFQMHEAIQTCKRGAVIVRQRFRGAVIVRQR